MCQVEEELFDLVKHFLGSCITTVDLVDHKDDRQVLGKSFRQHVSGLRKRTLCGIDEEKDPVYQRESAFNLAAEVGVTGSVDEIDLDALPLHLCCFGEDGDSSLTLLIVVVHDTINNGRMARERSSTPQKSIDKRRLSMVDVRDERNTSQFFRGCRHGSFRCRTTYWSSSASSSSSSKRTP